MNPDPNTPQPQIPNQIPTANPEPIVPVFQDPNIINNQQSQTNSATPNQNIPTPAPEIPVVQAPLQQPNPLPTSFFGNFLKNKIFILTAFVIVLLFLVGGVVYAFFNPKPNGMTVLTKSQYEDAIKMTPLPVPTVAPIATFAPIATPIEFRNPKGNANDVINLSLTAQRNLGVIQIPSSVNFIHTEVYKGIAIKWTSGQPIPSDRLQWLKNAIDKAPDFYTKNYPPQAIVSITTDELGMTPEQGNMATANYVAAASGTNMFLWPHFVKPNSSTSYYAPIDEKSVRLTLMHEWMHIVQYFDAVETYTDDYITHNIAGLYDLNYKDPLLVKFGDAAGWYYQPNWSTPTLKSDSQSQKTTDYGKMLEYEDMADTAAHIITCDTSMLSQARIDIISQIFGQSAQSFCK